MGTANSLGARGEKFVETRLAQLGYIIIERNWRTRTGEIDLIAENNGTIVFIEIKTRRNEAYGLPVEAVNIQKQAKLRAVAEEYLSSRENYEADCRFDVVTLENSPEGPIMEIFIEAF